MTISELEQIVQTYLGQLERKQKRYHYHERPFKLISFEKATCREILFEIQSSEEVPFYLEAVDILKAMKQLYDSAPGNMENFSIGADLIDFFIEKNSERETETGGGLYDF